MQRLNILTLALILALSGCVSQAAPTPDLAPLPDEADSVEEQTATGSTELAEEQEPDPLSLIEERLLPTGIIDVGSTDAPITLLAFTEHHCRYCKEFQLSFVPRLLREFVADGTLRLQLITYPLEKYRYSQQGAAGLLCAALQGQGLNMHDSLVQEEATTKEAILQRAGELELNIDQLAVCMEEEWTQQVLSQQASLARSLNVTLVPTFYLNGERLVGLPLYADLRGKIEQLLHE